MLSPNGPLKNSGKIVTTLILRDTSLLSPGKAVHETELLVDHDGPRFDVRSNNHFRSIGNHDGSTRRREIAGRCARKNTTAGREDHVRLVGERLDDHLSANSLRFADQPDDRVFGPGHFSRRRVKRWLLPSSRRPERRWLSARFRVAARDAS